MRDILQHLSEEKIIAIIRDIPESAMLQTAHALEQGGIRFIEVTLNTKGSLRAINRLKEELGENLFIGAGTVLDLDMAKEAVAAGAEYLLSPNLDEEVIAYALDQHIQIFPGTLTPSEIVRAVKLGAEVVKIFPTGSLGMNYLKELQGPLSHIKMIAMGGVNTDNIRDFFKAGAFAVGMGSNLIDKKLIQAGEFEKLSEIAKQYSDIVKNLN